MKVSLIKSIYLLQFANHFRFMISPYSFFQVNTAATEKLYDLIRVLSVSASPGDSQATDKNEENNILLDLCCGTGTIGIALSKSFKHVIGIEMVPEAIEDAKKNAELNSIANIEFFTGKVENVLPAILSKHSKDAKLTVVLDPPRNGTRIKTIYHITINNFRCQRHKSN